MLGYVDITEFVKDQGYGWYYCGGTTVKSNRSDDKFTSWRIVVIEEGESLPVKNLKLYLGGLHWQGNSNNFTIDQIVSSQNAKTQLLFFADGTRNDEEGKINIAMYDMNGTRKNVEAYPSGVSGQTYINQRTQQKSIMELMTKYGKLIRDIRTYHLQFTETRNGRILTHNPVGGDSELIEISNPFNNAIQRIDSSIYSRNHMLLSGMGLAIDLYVPTYQAEITSTMGYDGNMTIKGSTSNVFAKDAQTRTLQYDNGN